MALDWLLAQGDDIISIAGNRKRKYLQENVADVEVILTANVLRIVENLVAKYLGHWAAI